MNIAVKTHFVGIDVGKSELVLAVHGGHDPLTFANTGDGIAALTRHLISQQHAVQVALEATGGYEWPVWEALDTAGLIVRQVPPAQVRAFARCCGTRAKTDRIDAQILAAFCAFRPEAGRSLHDKSLRDLKSPW